jgi:hypothetical protein
MEEGEEEMRKGNQEREYKEKEYEDEEEKEGA